MAIWSRNKNTTTEVLPEVPPDAGESGDNSHPSTRRRLWGRKARVPGESAGISGLTVLTEPLALEAVDGPLLRTGSQTWAWFRIPPERWNFRSTSEREGGIRGWADQLAELAGHWCHLRVTHRPESPRSWARAHHQLAPAMDRLPDVPGQPNFGDYLQGEQVALEHRAMTSKQVFLGVLLATRSQVDRVAARTPRWLAERVPSLTGAELEGLAEEITTVTHALGTVGARLVTDQEMDWLLTRSWALGLPVAGQRPVAEGRRMSKDDLATFTDLATHYHAPYAPSVTVRGTGALAGQEASVVVLSVGEMQPMPIPEADEPWMAKADRLGVPVEWSARFYVRRSEEVAGELSHQMDRVRAQVRHYTDDHGLPPPMQLERQSMLVQEIDDEMSAGMTQRGVRTRGYYRLAVSAPTEPQALALARQLVDIYKPSVRIEHPRAQYAYAREFIPGEALATTGYERKGSVVWAAAAVPQATAEVGDARGVLLGETVTRTVRPVAWDPWLSQQEDNSGLTALLGGLGSGKSFLGGVIVYKSVRLGARWTVLDPSGPLAKLCDLPELKPWARAINLLDAPAGTLNPYRIVPDPRREDYADEPDPAAAYDQAATHADATRRSLVVDSLTGLLPYEVQQHGLTRLVLVRAARAVGGGSDRHPGMVLACLRDGLQVHAGDQVPTDQAEHARSLFTLLDEVGDRMRLLIPDHNDPDPDAGRDWRLTVLSMPGLTLPKPGVDKRDWDSREQESVVLLNLAAWLTQRGVYDLPKSVRKGVLIDEAAFLTYTSTGKVLMDRFARDSRKWNIRCVLASQVPADILSIPGIEVLLDSVLIGRLSGDEARSDALTLLKVPHGQGYEQVFEGFPGKPERGKDTAAAAAPTGARDKARHFLFRDSYGSVERIRADFSGPHLAHVLRALDTTPTAVATDPTTQVGPDLPEMTEITRDDNDDWSWDEGVA